MRYAFLRSGRWLGIAALTLLVAAVCVVLGFWQLSRHEYRAEQIALVAANAEQPPVPLMDLVDSPTSTLPADLEWRSVTVTGHYVGEPVGLPQRGVEDAAADHALAVLALDMPDGGAWLLAVDRGWYPTDAFVDSTDRLTLPEGEVSVVVRVRPAEPASDRDPVAGQVFRIAPAQVARRRGERRDDPRHARRGGVRLAGERGHRRRRTRRYRCRSRSPTTARTSPTPCSGGPSGCWRSSGSA